MYAAHNQHNIEANQNLMKKDWFLVPAIHSSLHYHEIKKSEDIASFILCYINTICIESSLRPNFDTLQILSKKPVKDEVFLVHTYFIVNFLNSEGFPISMYCEWNSRKLCTTLHIKNTSLYIAHKKDFPKPRIHFPFVICGFQSGEKSFQNS